MADRDLCTLETCSMDQAYIEYRPSVPGNAFFVGLFGLLLIGQCIVGIRYRTWPYMAVMTAGLILEILGYVGRVMLHDNPFEFNNFLLYLICLTIGPAFFAAAIYFSLGRIVIIYGENISRIRPRTYTIIFVSCDILSLILQAAGGAITSIAESDEVSLRNTGINIMIAGLAFQVVSLTLFMTLAVEFAFRVRSRPDQKNEAMRSVRESWTWKAFLLGIATSTLVIFVRSIFRVAELKGGFDSDLANDEVALMVLEGAMISIACISLTVAHPGLIVGRMWNEIKPASRKTLEVEMMSPSSS